jgi:hypothetical protein
MKLFNRSSSAEEKWHKKAIFVNLSKTRIVFVDTTETKPECEPSRIPKMEPQSVIEELLNQEEYGLLWFLDRSISTRQTDGNVEDWDVTSVQVTRTEKRKNLNCDLLLPQNRDLMLPQNRLPFPIISHYLLY